LAKLNKQQLDAIKEKVRQQKAEAAQQKQIEELKLKESGNTQDQEDTTPKTLAEVKKALEKQKQEAVQHGQPQQTQKQKLKKIKKEVRGKLTQTKGRQMTWNCNIGDLVEIPGRLYGGGEDLYGIVVKESIDDRGVAGYTGSRVVTDNTQFQILTTGGFRWVYAKGLKKIEVD
jgi:hypothetical protein